MSVPSSSNQEETIVQAGSTEEDIIFSKIVDSLEEAITKEDFLEVLEGFCKKNCKVFEDKECNKLEYTTIFKQYCQTVEEYLENMIKKRIPDFSMKSFLQILAERPGQLTGELWDILVTFSDFEAFKQIMVSYNVRGDGSEEKEDNDLVVSGTSKINKDL